MNLSSQVTLFNRVSFTDKLLFTKHMAVMMKSGIPIGEAVDIIRDQSSNPALKALLTDILTQLNNGQSLEKALSTHPNTFDPFYIGVIHFGEESGNLEKNLEYLAQQIKNQYEFNKKVQGALLYPAIVLLTTVIAGGAISFFVLPKLIDLFTSLDVKLPLSTQILLFIAYTMKNYGVIILAALIVLYVIFRLLIRKPKIKIYWHKLLLSLPIIGIFLQDVSIAFFCRNLGIMLKSGLPITTALSAQHDATTNLVYKNYLKEIEEGVRKGRSISDILTRKHFPHISSIVIKMIAVGEKTGKLDESLLYLGEFFESEVDNYSKNFSTILEPVVLILVGLGVAFVALAIISPIYQLTSGIHR